MGVHSYIDNVNKRVDKTNGSIYKGITIVIEALSLLCNGSRIDAKGLSNQSLVSF